MAPPSSALPAQIDSQYLQSIIDSAEDVIICKSLTGRIQSWNRAAERVFGYSAEEMIGQAMTVLFPEDRLQEEEEILTRIRSGERVEHFETVRRCRNGRLVNLSMTISPILDALGEVVGASNIARDITERLRIQHMLWLQENFDSLTGLPHRRAFQEDLQKRISSTEPTCVGVVVINLDHLKQINDAMGRQVGDQVIATVAGRLREAVRTGDLVSRLGGDEFGLALYCERSANEVDSITARVLDFLREAIPVGDGQIYGSASIGVAVFPRDGSDARDLIARAEMALHEAKRLGGGCIQQYAQPLEAGAQRRLTLANDLRGAIARNELFLQFQPIVSLRTGLIRKCEALLRWRHPSLGMVSPAAFIPIAEQTAQIDPIGDWVFQEALAPLKTWQAEIDPSFQVSINLSPGQLKPSALSRMDWPLELERAGMAAGSVIVEVTESMMLSADMARSQRLESMQRAGFELAVDDFGTGYSSLSQLSRINGRYLKIDRAFIGNLTRSAKDQALCKAIIALAHALDLVVVAEGVETQEQAELLRSWACDFAQGYWFGRPMSAVELGALAQSPSRSQDN